MAAHIVKYVIPGGTFNHVGRDQINLNVVNVTNIVPHWYPPSTHHHPISNPSWPTSSHHTKSLLVATHHMSEVISVVHVAVDLTQKIAQLLVNDGKSSGHNRELKLELELLHEALLSTGTAILAFKHTFLDGILANIINPEVGRCFATLRSVFDKINRCRKCSINALWPKDCWSRCELNSLSERLFIHRESLYGLLLALNS